MAAAEVAVPGAVAVGAAVDTGRRESGVEVDNVRRRSGVSMMLISVRFFSVYHSHYGLPFDDQNIPASSKTEYRYNLKKDRNDGLM